MCCKWTVVMQVCLGIFQLGICLVFTIVGLAAPNWVNYESTVGILKVDINLGLWKFCSADTCVDLPDSLETSKIEAARAFGILGVITAMGSIVPAVIYLMRKNSNMLLPSAISAFVTFVFVLIMLITAAEGVKDSSTNWGYCFGLVIAGLIQAFFGSTTFFGAKHMDARQCC